MDPVVATIVDYLRDAHQNLRKNVQDLDAAALNWVPGPEMNSIATLVIHSLGSERDTLRVLLGLPSDRDRRAEFVKQVSGPGELLVRLDEVDGLLDQIASTLTAEKLMAPHDRQSRGPRTGLYWLLSSFGHLREHLAHLELTSQLYQQQRA